MAPNIIGSTFLLTQTAISNNDENNNDSSSAKVAAGATPPSAATVSSVQPSVQSTQQSVTASEQRVPHQGEHVGVVQLKSSTVSTQSSEDSKSKKPFVMEIVWGNVLLFIILHSTALYGVWLIFAENAYLEFLIGMIFGLFGGFGITAGVHRLWSHRSYKAKTPLRIFLMLCQSMAFQNSIHEWTRDHRVHHKFTDTDADPHNSRRGFFFAHMGWLMCKKHPDVKEKGKQIDLSDLEADPVVMFQKKYYFFIMPICCFVIPALFPYFYMGSSLPVCFFVCSMLRYTISLHGTWLVNSAAHFYGMKPYDLTISPADSKLVSTVAFGEGWHNYHHVFPWDYKAAELGSYQYNWTTAFLNLMARIGQAYDLKSVSRELVLKRVNRTGDGSHPSVTDMNNNTEITTEMVAQLNHEDEPTMVWGWDDKDVCDDDRKGANIIEKKDD